MLGLVGQKCGMTRRFTELGQSVPVTVIQILPNRITQIKLPESDGYHAIQVTTGQKRAHLLNKPQQGHLAKAEVGTGLGLWEFRVRADDKVFDKTIADLKVGDELTVDLFTVGHKVDVTGTTKGRGFSGTIRRHNFAGQDATHGNSLSHRAPGSIGQNQTPGRVFKNKKMAGQYGNTRNTQQSLQVLDVDPTRHLLLIKGAVPGPAHAIVTVCSAVKWSAKDGQ